MGALILCNQEVPRVYLASVLSLPGGQQYSATLQGCCKDDTKFIFVKPFEHWKHYLSAKDEDEDDDDAN